MKRYITSVLTFLISFSSLPGQIYSNKVSQPSDLEEMDSVITKKYNYLLPIWGEKAIEAGFDIPYSAGIGVNYFWQESEMVINNLNVGFNNSKRYNLDEIVRFNDVIASTSIVNVRPDIWLFPFLNVYGIFAVSQISTSVDFSVYTPTQGSPAKLFDYSTSASFSATSTGFGLTPTMGIRGGWIALDMNLTWSDIEGLKNPAFSFVFGPRLGKSFQLRKPESNIVLWVGGFRVKLNTDTDGSLAFNDLIETETLNQKISDGIVEVENRQNELDTWYNGLTPAEKAQSTVEYTTKTTALDAAQTILFRTSDALSTIENSTVQYDLDKEPQDKWNFIIGSQYQLNKHWMLRAEVGFLRSRSQVITGIQYRFRL
ncbi:hypothetical protein ACFLU5_13120 [Bacteroidota bacterium]